MQLIVKDYETPSSIEFNFEELKQELMEKVAHYETLVYTDDQIKEAKADRANLNKLKKALNDERLRREREYMEPFNEFKGKVNEIISIIDKPCALIDAQVKAYEEKCREDKRAEIQAYFDDLESVPDWLRGHLEMIFDEKWLNAGPSMKAIREEIDERLTTIWADLETLESLPEFSFEAVEVYKANLDINRAIQEGRRLADLQKRKQEQERLEAERKAQEEEAKKVAPTACQPAEPVEVWEHEPKFVEDKGGAIWIGFKAYLTTEQALMLRDFFQSNGIEYQPMAVNEWEGRAC